uniref:Thioesterase/acetyltransferase domain protein n=1 Tax=uncultured bacterium ws034A6 TaxID=1131824 RepID=I1X585_9BACT|nr:thioesterase/acetyltransferase domain protein [uncultured bacterium ws034A6]
MRVTEPVTAEEFDQYYELRWKILRAPWNQARGSERVSDDETSTHLMVRGDDSKLIGVGRLHFNSIREAQIRFMAIDLPEQRKGIGTRLLQALEARAIEHGASSITLDARETAMGFYRKQGYSPQGPGHTLFNSIAHVKMMKEL